MGRVIGEMDYLTRPTYLTLLGDLMAARNPYVVLDLSEVTFCDSAGLNVLLAANRIAANNGASLALACVPPQLRQVFELTGVDQLLVIHDTVAEAVTVCEAELSRDRAKPLTGEAGDEAGEPQ